MPAASWVYAMGCHRFKYLYVCISSHEKAEYGRISVCKMLIVDTVYVTRVGFKQMEKEMKICVR